MKPQGDPGQIGAAAGPWQSAGDTLSQWQGALEGSLPADWVGDAANAFHKDWDDLKGKMGRGVQGLHGASGAISELSRNLSTAQGEWGRAASAASSGGLTLSDGGEIDKAGRMVGSVDGSQAGTDPTVARAVSAVMSLGRQAELDAAAANRLAADKFEAAASIAYGGDLSTALMILSQGAGLLGNSGAGLDKGLKALEDTTKKADALFKDSTAAAQLGKSNASELARMMHSSDPAERSFAAGRLRQAGQDAKALFAEAGKASAALDGAKGAEAALKDPAWSKFLQAVDVGKGIPVIDIVANGLGFAGDLAEGNSVAEAGVRTAVSYGAAFGTVALVGALMTPGVGEVIVAGLAAGAIAYGVDQGVKYVWEHWDGISHGISSAAHAVGNFFSSIF